MGIPFLPGFGACRLATRGKTFRSKTAFNLSYYSTKQADRQPVSESLPPALAYFKLSSNRETASR